MNPMSNGFRAIVAHLSPGRPASLGPLCKACGSEAFMRTDHLTCCSVCSNPEVDGNCWDDFDLTADYPLPFALRDVVARAAQDDADPKVENGLLEVLIAELHKRDRLAVDSLLALREHRTVAHEAAARDFHMQTSVLAFLGVEIPA